MYGKLLYVIYVCTIPFGIVQNVNGNDVIVLNLLSDAYIRRMNIGVGSLIKIHPDGMIIEQVTNNDETIQVHHERSSSIPVFRKWFAFRDQFEDFLGYSTCRLLFVHGIQTKKNLAHAVRDDPYRILSIPGIGPSIMKRIKTIVTKKHM